MPKASGWSKVPAAFASPEPMAERSFLINVRTRVRLDRFTSRVDELAPPAPKQTSLLLYFGSLSWAIFAPYGLFSNF